MKLKDYIEKLNKLAEDPANLDLDLYTSIDDEGNGFNRVNFGPEVGYMDDGGDFVPVSAIEKEPDSYGHFAETPPTTICLN